MPGVSVLPSTIHFVADWWQSAALFAAWDVSRQGTLLEGSPDSLAKLDAVLCEQLRGHAAQSSEHGPPGVDDLDLTIPAPADKPVTAMHRCMTPWCTAY